jgi:hypothetical protein
LESLKTTELVVKNVQIDNLLRQVNILKTLGPTNINPDVLKTKNEMT